MTEKEQDELVERLAAEYTRQLDYIRASTVLLGLLPAFYGILTFIFSDRLWGNSPVYRTALELPYAPESWGTIFVFLGLGVMISASLHRHRCTAILCCATATVLSMFMVTFLTEVVRQSAPNAVPPAVVYGVFSLLFMNRARLAWTSR